MQPANLGLTPAHRRVDLALEGRLEPLGHLGLVLRPELGQPVLPPDIGRLHADRAVGRHDPIELVDHLLRIGQPHVLLTASPPAEKHQSITHANASQAAGHECSQQQDAKTKGTPFHPSSDHGEPRTRAIDPITLVSLLIRIDFAGCSSKSSRTGADCKFFLMSLHLRVGIRLERRVSQTTKSHFRET